MERLTIKKNKRSPGRYRDAGEYTYRCKITELVEKLSAYENTGLTPEQCAEYATKHTPQKTDVGSCGDYISCPTCHSEVVGYYAAYCEHCGQALDRYDEEERKEQAAEQALEGKGHESTATN